MNEVSETALITLRSRVIESEKEQPVIEDPVGRACYEGLLDRIAPEVRDRIIERKYAPVLTRYIALRARKYDRLCREFLAECPEGLIVNLGCGFDTRFWRLQLENQQYIEVDLPPVVSLKKEILGDRITYRMVDGSVLDEEWLTLVKTEKTSRVLFLAEGLFMYLPGEESIRVLKRMADTFSSSRLVMEVVHAKYTRGFRKKMVEQKMRRRAGSTAGDYYLYGIGRPEELESYHPRFRVKELWSYYDDPEVKPALLRLFRNIKSISRAQYTLVADMA